MNNIANYIRKYYSPGGDSLPRENMYYGADSFVFRKAAELRNRMTPAEEVLWNALHINEWKLKFRRQHPIAHWVVDFYCHAKRFVIELDGGIHESEEVKMNDKKREEYLRNLGLTILRFKNEEVINNTGAVLKKIAQSIEMLPNTPLGDRGGNDAPLYIIKIGGNIIDDEGKLASFLQRFAGAGGHKILVHGGGKLATRLADELKIPQQISEGRRITDAETLKIVTMVYAGYINKNIVAQLQAAGCDAAGLSGADGNIVTAHKRQDPVTDFGFVGDVDAVNITFLDQLLAGGRVPVIAPITHDGKGQLLNTNADTIAQEIAKALSGKYDTSLIYTFEKSGVLLDAGNDATLISRLNPGYYRELKRAGKIYAGMIPKLDNAFAALDCGVKKVVIGKAEDLEGLIAGTTGTSIEHA